MTVRTVGEATGAPSGSVYHLFGSRDLLVARLWVRTVRRFQEGFLAALAGDDLDAAALGAALHVVRWARAHPAEATVLLLRRRSELADRWPDELGDELAGLNHAAEAALADHATRRYGTLDELGRVTFALVDVPYAACRRPLLAGRPVPEAQEALVTDTVAHTLGFRLPPP